MKKTLVVNKRKVSRKTFWSTVKNMSVITRLHRAKKVKVWYSMPYGGQKECNDYNLYSIDIIT